MFPHKNKKKLHWSKIAWNTRKEGKRRKMIVSCARCRLAGAQRMALEGNKTLTDSYTWCAAQVRTLVL
jgi:hypothetical protein